MGRRPLHPAVIQLSETPVNLIQKLYVDRPEPSYRHERRTVGLICLANSRKYGGRCVAGLRLDGSGWIRPVTLDRDSKGALPLQSIRLEDGSEPRLLDAIEIVVREDLPAAHHPENWLVDRAPWKLVGRPGNFGLLDPFVERGPLLLGSTGDRVPEQVFADHPARASLALVRPDNDRVTWQNRESHNGGLQHRAQFSLKGQPYNLVITDPAWEIRLGRFEAGEVHPSRLGIRPGAWILLTISLGEPFNGYCYKYVAGVIIL